MRIEFAVRGYPFPINEHIEAGKQLCRPLLSVTICSLVTVLDNLNRFSNDGRSLNSGSAVGKLMRKMNGGGNMNNASGDVTLNMGSSYDAEASAGMSMRRSNQMVDDLLDSGANILGSLHEQKDRLKSARRKVLNVLDTLGVSQSVLKVIDRRQRMDAIIVYGGMFVITFFIFVFWWFTRR